MTEGCTQRPRHIAVQNAGTSPRKRDEERRTNTGKRQTRLQYKRAFVFTTLRARVLLTELRDVPVTTHTGY